MDQDTISRWQAFAQTGDIHHYLSYKRQLDGAARAAREGTSDERDRNTGPGASGTEIR